MVLQARSSVTGAAADTAAGTPPQLADRKPEEEQLAEDVFQLHCPGVRTLSTAAPPPSEEQVHS